MARDYYDRNRNFWNRSRDEVRSWFGDEDAERRRDLDSRREEWEETGWQFRNPYRERPQQYGGPADREYDRDWDLDRRFSHFDDYRSRYPADSGPGRQWHGRDSESLYGGSSAGRWGGRAGMPVPRSAGQRPSEDFSGRGPSGYRRADERIQEELNDRLTWDPSVDATDLTVKVSDGVATLSGHVRDRWMKRRAEDLADSIRGVKDVHNQIMVQNGQTEATEL